MRSTVLQTDVTQFANHEGVVEFNFHRAGRANVPGVSAMLRVKNEQSKIGDCLRSIYELFDEIVVIDNQSTDATLPIVQRFMAVDDPENKVVLFHYPFAIARCGAEHRHTPENSLHSLVYYYNWCLSHCTRAYVCKWDADMVLIRDRREQLRYFMGALQPSCDMMIELKIQTVYRSQEGYYYKSETEINREIRIFPNSKHVRFHKADLWEMVESDYPIPWRCFEGLCIYEIKDVNEDEFSHWTSTDFPTTRKKQEWENFNKVACGNIPTHGFTRIEKSW